MVGMLQEVLKVELGRLQQLFQEIKVCRLPLNPALVVQGIEAEVSLAPARDRGANVMWLCGSIKGERESVAASLGNHFTDSKQSHLLNWALGWPHSVQALHACLTLHSAGSRDVSSLPPATCPAVMLELARAPGFLAAETWLPACLVALGGSFFASSKTLPCHTWEQIKV